MAFSQAERVQIRRWVGGDFFYVFSRQRLESAMTTVESGLNDGGETENYIRDTLLVNLESTYQDLLALIPKQLVLDVDEVKLDPVRGRAGVCAIGRILSTQLAHSLGLHAVLRDAWAFGGTDVMQELSEFKGAG